MQTNKQIFSKLDCTATEVVVDWLFENGFDEHLFLSYICNGYYASQLFIGNTCIAVMSAFLVAFSSCCGATEEEEEVLLALALDATLLSMSSSGCNMMQEVRTKAGSNRQWLFDVDVLWDMLVAMKNYSTYIRGKLKILRGVECS